VTHGVCDPRQGSCHRAARRQRLPIRSGARAIASVTTLQQRMNEKRAKPRWPLFLVIVAGLGLIVALRVSASLRRNAESRNCASQVVSICFGALLWANEHAGSFPTNFSCMSNELNSPKILVCAADHSRKRSSDWVAFSASGSSYDMISPGIHEGDTNTVFLRCRVHGHLGYTDGTVFDGIRRHRKYD